MAAKDSEWATKLVANLAELARLRAMLDTRVYECERDCGFLGSFGAVAAHESQPCTDTATHSAPPAPQATQRRRAGAPASADGGTGAPPERMVLPPRPPLPAASSPVAPATAPITKKHASPTAPAPAPDRTAAAYPAAVVRKAR